MTTGRRKILGKIVPTLFLSIFLGLGLVISYLLVLEVFQTVGTYSWPRTTCTILESAAADKPEDVDDPFIFRVRYRYLAEGAERESDRFRHGYYGSDDASEPERLVFRYPVGAEVPCYVDPDDPESAMLERRPLWFGFVILLPLLFVAVGGGGIYFLWRSPRGAGEGDAGEAKNPLAGAISAKKAASTGATGCMIGFFGIFFAAGAGILIPFFLLPIWHTFESRSWTPTPCQIVSSEVQSHPGDDSTTYSVDILYQYEAGGRRLRSNRFDFFSGSTSGYDSKRKIVDRYPPESEATCYVDPDDPTQAVLTTELRGEFLFGLMALPFLLVGAGGLWWVISSHFKKRGQPAGPAARAVAKLPPLPGRRGRPKELDRKLGSLGKFFVTLAIAGFWNGIVGVFLWSLWESWQEGVFEGCLALFLLPFVLIGLLLLVGVPYQFLALFNPRIELTLDDGAWRLGESSKVSWTMTRFADRVRRLTLKLEGEERATIHKETSTSTSYSSSTSTRSLPVGKVDLFETERPDLIVDGETVVELPRDTMHSFGGDKNQVRWTLKVRGEIPFWPDVFEDFKVEIEPARPRVPPAGRPTAEVPDPVPAPEVPAAGPDGEPASGMEIVLAAGRYTFEPGEILAGEVRWTLPEAPKSAELKLFWHTEGESSQDVGVVAEETLPTDREVRHRFQFELPAGPYSYRGKMFTIRWALELLVDPAGVRRLPLTVSPTLSELVAAQDDEE